MYKSIELPRKFHKEDILLGAGLIKNSVLAYGHHANLFLIGHRFSKSGNSFGLEVYLGFWFISIAV